MSTTADDTFDLATLGESPEVLPKEPNEDDCFSLGQTEPYISYDVVWGGRVIDVYMAHNSDEAVAKWRRCSEIVGPRFYDGIYGYSRPGVGMSGVTAVPSFPGGEA